MSVLTRVGGMFGAPARTFEAAKREHLGETVAYYLVILLLLCIPVVVGSVVVYRLFLAYQLGEYGWIGWLAIVILVPVLIIGALVALLVFSLIVHPFVYALGGHAGVGGTIKTLAYGSTPLVLGGWIAPLIPVFALWSLVLSVVGLRKVHGLSAWRAIFALLLAIGGVALVGSAVSLGVSVLREMG